MIQLDIPTSSTAGFWGALLSLSRHYGFDGFGKSNDSKRKSGVELMLTTTLKAHSHDLGVSY